MHKKIDDLQRGLVKDVVTLAVAVDTKPDGHNRYIIPDLAPLNCSIVSWSESLPPLLRGSLDKRPLAVRYDDEDSTGSSSKHFLTP